MGDVFLLPTQAAFVRSRATVAAFVGGYGAGSRGRVWPRPSRWRPYPLTCAGYMSSPPAPSTGRSRPLWEQG